MENNTVDFSDYTVAEALYIMDDASVYGFEFYVENHCIKMIEP